eukprot:TRINITY_DN443_c0_g1_i1.p3 TRINITY_DN443_c0_g1~~TRINITY_DN443_c0_g1_i1.p3  ORF type:complete len:140 (-),score=42.59 TRINITY_DN443_c0_g1_i1:1056-1475(-)
MSESNASLFSNSLLSEGLKGVDDFSIREEDGKVLFKDHFVVRALERDDNQKGYLEVLAQLTTVGDIDDEAFGARFDLMMKKGGYLIVVLEDVETGKIAGSGSCVVEEKFIHECGRVGHVEDIVVSEDHRGKSAGKAYVK